MEILEAEVEFAEGITSGKELFLRQIFNRNIVILSEPLEGLNVLPSILVDVAD